MSGTNDYPPAGTTKAEWPAIVRDLIARDAGSGSPAVIDALLCWLQDCNWPGNPDAWRYLLSLGERVIPHALRVLEGDDGLWKYCVINVLVDRWPEEYVSRIAPRLKSIASQNDKDELNISSAKVLIEKRLLAGDEAREILSKIKGWQPKLGEEVDELSALLDHSA